jgi:DNA-binding NtrC family response regulator
LSDDEKPFLLTNPITDEEMAQYRELQRAHALREHRSLVIYHRDGVQVVPLVEGQSVVIGRSPPADQTIRDNSLSRQHACVELFDGEVWVEDLSSTNGTWLNGERVEERRKVEPEDELTFGVVTATVHTLEAMEARRHGLDSHDCFAAELEREAARARAFGRSLAMLMLRSGDRGGPHPFRWIAAVQRLLRPFDRIALYSADTVEVLVPEADEQQALELADAIFASSKGSLRCGLASLPAHAGSAGELLEVARRALQRTSGRQPLTRAPSPAAGEHGGDSAGPVVRSAAMCRVFEMVERLAATAIPVLILGETGTGKEVIARAIHRGGKRSDKPILCVNCGAIPGQLVESTLFGHEKGAFTGATGQAKGVFEAADGGTVLLDEIGELPPATQIALLRVLETKRITRVGSNREIDVDVRILAATHRDLEAMCRAGEFREDLLYRLNTMTLKVPPLRERPDEIEALVAHFIEEANRVNDCRVAGIAAEALKLLARYSWPGNVRELRNAIERAVVIAFESDISVEDLPERVRELEAPVKVMEAGGGEGTAINLQGELRRVESELILDALREADWDRKTAARNLGLPLRTLARRMQAHGIRRVGYQELKGE